jgi:hypothetical protein
MSAGIWIESIPGQIAILERDDCESWSMLYDLTSPELANGAMFIGQALCLSRDLDREYADNG